MVYTRSLCQCYVRDGTGRLVYEETWPSSTPACQLVGKVASSLKYKPSSIQLVIQLGSEHVILTENTESSLEKMGLSTEVGNRNKLNLEGVGGKEANIVRIDAADSTDPDTNESQELQHQPPKPLITFDTKSCLPETGGKTTTQNSETWMKKSSENTIGSVMYNPKKFNLCNYSFALSSLDSQAASTSVKDPGFVGLVNQAMTCYLNSLLQALFMTPEFRNALYKWKYEGSKPEKSIPFQLQKLFLNLQTTSRSAVETTELTQSFGWGTGDVWHQHDVQELCRVMFDALEQEFKHTSQADLINQLYQGKMIDYVKCLECKREKSREDTYLDIPLPVRPFGSTIAYSSVEEAMRAFVQPETLDGNNQYDCESCGKKVNAHKGLKFSSLPYLLTLHLKRFDFDYSTLHRIKLNDKVIFPEFLDLRSFVTKVGGSGDICSDDTPMMEEGMSIGRADDSSTADSALDDDSAVIANSSTVFDSSAPTPSTDHDQDDDEGIEMSGRGSVAASGSSSGSESDRLAEVPSGRDEIDLGLDPATSKASNSIDLMTTLPHQYELYAIMIHSGSASGGHYYAYIKDFISNQWFCFNDQSVTRVTHEDIEKTYGGGPSRGYYSGVYSSSTNAYMLMYRLIDKSRNTLPMSPPEFPPHLQKLVAEMKEHEEIEKAHRARQENMIKVKVYWNGNGNSPSNQAKLALDHETTLLIALKTAYAKLQLSSVIPEEQCRLVLYNHSSYQMEMSFDGRENEPIGNIFSQLVPHITFPIEFLIEPRSKEQTFLPYSSTDIRIPVCGVSFEKEEVISADVIQVSSNLDFNELKISMKKWLPGLLCGEPFTTDLCIVFYDSSAQTLALITELSKPLCYFFFGGEPKLFVAPLTPSLQADLENGFQSSPLSNYFKFLDKIKNTVILNFTLPNVSEENLELHFIPPLAEQKLSNKGVGNKTTEGINGDGPVCIEEESLGCGVVSDQSTSEDSSLTDSERTIIGEPVVEFQSSSTSDSEHQMSSPEPVTITQYVDEKWDDIPNNMPVDYTWDNSQPMGMVYETQQPRPTPKMYYLKVTPYMQNNVRMLKVVVDRNANWEWFINSLEPYFGVKSRYVRVAGYDSEIYLSTLNDNANLVVELNRPISHNETKCKIFFFRPNPKPLELITEWIITKGQTIGEIKKALLKHLEKINFSNKIIPPLNRCRLRKMNWRSVERPLLDFEVLDINAMSTLDLFLEVLDGDEPMTSLNQTLVLVTRFRPNTLSTDPFTQIVFESGNPSELLDKLVEISGIPKEHLKAAEGPNQFPWNVDFSFQEYEWDSVINIVNSYSREDGTQVIMYKDDREGLKTSSSGMKDSRCGTDDLTTPATTIPRPTPSPRREKPLKIYLDSSSSSNTTTATQHASPESYDL